MSTWGTESVSTNKRSNLSTPTFMDLALAGKMKNPEAEIHDYVEKWHNEGGESALHTYLGMTWGEYKEFVDNGDSATLGIIEARKTA